jgi:hypothetical protein
MTRIVPLVVALLLTLIPHAAIAEATKPGVFYVTATSLNERLAPNSSAHVTNKLYRQQRVEVFEVRDGWARVSPYYDGSVEGVAGKVARWVGAAYLAPKRPEDLPQAKIGTDPRIELPSVGDYGLTATDVKILNRAAHHYLKSGRCKRVEWGDKSTSRAGTYYINCGGPTNIFFRPGDIPAA